MIGLDKKLRKFLLLALTFYFITFPLLAKDSTVRFDISEYTARKLNQKINKTFNNWANQYGTMRFNIGLNEKFKFSNTQIDALFPIKEGNAALWFMQAGYQNLLSKHQFNIGSGMRIFSSDAMLGANSFFDYSTSNKHYRIGLGLEYWQNYLKLTNNYYFGLSEWDLDKEVNFYTKPANGFDLNQDFYLPFWPSFGMTLAYEKYFGDLSKTKLEKIDQEFFILGINYDFVPLIGIKAHYKINKEKEKTAFIGLNTTYRFGVPLMAQLEIKNIDFLRRISGNRYDLVTRNNDIILQYDKSLNIKMNSNIVGIEGEEKKIFHTIALDKNFRIENWEGSIKSNLSPECWRIESLKECRIKLPSYNVVTSSNSYDLFLY